MIDPLTKVGLWLATKSCGCKAVSCRRYGVDKGFPPEDPAEAIVSAFADRMRPILGRQIDAVIAKLRSSGLTGYQLATQAALEVAKPEFAIATIAAAKPMLDEAIGLGSRVGLAEIGVDPFDVFNPSVQRWVDTSATRLAEDVTLGTTTRVADLLGRSLEQGRSIDDIAADLTASGYDEVRSERIARYESARAYSHGQIEGWDQSGVVAGKRWLLSPEACEFCVSVAATFSERTVGLRDSFLPVGSTVVGAQGGTMNIDHETVYGPPLHPGCRCAMTAVLSR